MIILQLFYIRVCQELVNIMLFFFTIPGNYFFMLLKLLSQVISLFTSLTKEEKKVCSSKAKNKHLLHSFILTCHSWLPHDWQRAHWNIPEFQFCMPFFAFKSKSYPWDLLVIFLSIILKDQRNLISISFAFCTSVIPLF